MRAINRADVIARPKRRGSEPGKAERLAELIATRKPWSRPRRRKAVASPDPPTALDLERDGEQFLLWAV